MAVLLLWIEGKGVTFVKRIQWQEGTHCGRTESKVFWAEEMLPNVKLSTEKHNLSPPTPNPATLLSV